MSGDVLVAEFQAPDGKRMRLYRVLDDSEQAWSDIERQGLNEYRRKLLSITQRGIVQGVRDGHLVSSFLIKALDEGSWTPMTSFAIINDTAGVEPVVGNRITTVFDSALPYMNKAFIHAIIFWTLFDLCGLDTDEDIFARALFGLQIPTPVDDDKLAAWRNSEAYQAMEMRIASWANKPPTSIIAAQHKGIDFVEWGEVLFDDAPSSAMHYDHHVVSPFSDEDEMTDNGIEWALTFEGVEQYLVSLCLFDEATSDPVTPWWGVSPDYQTIRPVEGPCTDLLEVLIGSNIILPASEYEAWMDARTAVPTQLFIHVDAEPYLLLGTRVPWLWSAAEARSFFAALRGG